MKKKLNEAAMENELAGSVYFNPNLTPNPVDKKLVRANIEKLKKEAGFTKIMEEDGTDVSPTPNRPLQGTTGAHEANKPKQRNNEPPKERLVERAKIRHTFDIFSDQLLSLKEISVNREKETGKRVLIGDLVQEALDKLIEHQHLVEAALEEERLEEQIIERRVGNKRINDR